MHGFQQNETCQACSAPISLAQDACPHCDAHLFWLVVPKRPLSALERKQFVSEMLTITQQAIDPDYLDVDGHLWLPGDFWQQDPQGDSLRIFPWLSQLQMHQHAQPANTAQAQPAHDAYDPHDADLVPLPSENEAAHLPPLEQDTLPGVTEAELQAREKQQRHGAASARPARASAQRPRTAPNTSQQAKPRQQARPKLTSATLAAPPKPVAPVAILLFFILLGLSYLSLYVQRNQRDIAFVEARPQTLEIPAESTDPQQEEANP